MGEVVHRVVGSPWAPRVVRDGEVLLVEIGVDFNRGYDIREFRFPITVEQFDVLRGNLVRHLLLWRVLEDLCLAAGRSGGGAAPGTVAVQRAIGVVLGGSEDEVEAYFAREGVGWRQLIAHGARPELLNEGKLFAAFEAGARAIGDQDLVWEYDANRDRARRGVTLGPLDTALLKYTGRYLHGGTVPRRVPGAVEPEQLPAVLAVVAKAEATCADVPDSASSAVFAAAVEAALAAHEPALAVDAVATVSFLVFAEAAARHRAAERGRG
ncbi:hypothetical protein BJP25_23700 [Actinokineospora bangkokensis]|uniref:Uncharacterized protein n=2 Tax=Actinokineospora bangkokensis TaxID=1193682 RepID=A0A1Q9LIJ4_9PSEU|nr:hypothetical protein BJP25_23700 [Actinokineospora bangkokensis]